MHIPNPVANNNNSNDNVIRNNAIISVVSVTLSQILSNVPFVALYSNVMINNGLNANDVSEWMMFAAASTIAGNLTIFGAASNIIIIEAAESRGVKAFSFFEFFKIGSVVTASNIIIYYVFSTFLLSNISLSESTAIFSIPKSMPNAPIGSYSDLSGASTTIIK
jgi:Na+/H+ antiporter NhaD/arsenite permease-like protein